MDIETATKIFLMYNSRPMLTEDEDHLFNEAADILEDNCLLDENGNLIDEDEE